MQPVQDEMAQSDAMYVAFLSELAVRATESSLVGSARLPSLDDFRSIVMADADVIRGLFREATSRRLDALSHDERSTLRVLEADPDLLSPLDELRYEPAHSRLMGYFMNRARCPELAPLLVRELLLLAGQSEDLVTDEEVGNSAVATEVVISDGRLDVCIEGRNCLTYVELKIDSREGRDQRKRSGWVLLACAGHGTRVA